MPPRAAPRRFFLPRRLHFLAARRARPGELRIKLHLVKTHLQFKGQKREKGRDRARGGALFTIRVLSYAIIVRTESLFVFVSATGGGGDGSRKFVAIAVW